MCASTKISHGDSAKALKTSSKFKKQVVWPFLKIHNTLLYFVLNPFLKTNFANLPILFLVKDPKQESVKNPMWVLFV